MMAEDFYGPDWVYDVTLLFSGSLYVTSNVFFHEFIAVQMILDHLNKVGDNLLSAMAVTMKMKFEKHWENVDHLNFLLHVVVVLDPCYKLKYVHFCLEQTYEHVSVTMMVERIEDAVTRLYDYYLDHNSSSNNGLSVCSSSQAASEMSLAKSGEDTHKLLATQFARHLQAQESVEPKSELHRYLFESCEKDTGSFDNLAWWKINSPKYPILSQMARFVLAIRVSTVASESAFSTGGCTLDQFGSSLSPLIFEALICAQNWLRSAPTTIALEENPCGLENYEEIESEFPGIEFASSCGGC